MLNNENTKAAYATPTIKEYGSVSDLVGTQLNGPGNPDGMGAAYNS